MDKLGTVLGCLLGALVTGIVLGVPFGRALHESTTTANDGDATSERCVQDCATWAKRTTDELRRFCAEPGRKCESLAERTDATNFRPLYRPGTMGRHAACGCTDGQARMLSIWNVDEVW